MLNLSSEINAIYLAFIKKLGFIIQPTNIVIQKIDGNMPKTNRIIVMAFSVTDQVEKVRFFKETLLMANFNLDVVFEMFFFIFNGINIDFLKKKFW